MDPIDTTMIILIVFISSFLAFIVSQNMSLRRDIEITESLLEQSDAVKATMEIVTAVLEMQKRINSKSNSKK